MRSGSDSEEEVAPDSSQEDLYETESSVENISPKRKNAKKRAKMTRKIVKNVLKRKFICFSFFQELFMYNKNISSAAKTSNRTKKGKNRWKTRKESRGTTVRPH